MIEIITIMIIMVMMMTVAVVVGVLLVMVMVMARNLYHSEAHNFSTDPFHLKMPLTLIEAWCLLINVCLYSFFYSSHTLKFMNNTDLCLSLNS